MAMEEITHEGLRRRLDEVLGEEYGAKLMGYLPGAEPATREDFKHLEDKLEVRFGSLEVRFESLEERIDERFKGVGERFKSVDEHFKGLDEHFKGLDERFRLFDQNVNSRLEGMEGRLVGEIHKALTAQTRLYIFSMLGIMIAFATATGFMS